MAHKKHQTGCTCCCKHVYHGGSNVRMVNLSRWDTDRYYLSPNDANFSNFSWTIDHYSEQIFFMGAWFTAGTTTKIGKCDMKLTDARADIVITEVVDYGSSFISGMICTASEDEMVIYCVDDAVATTTLHFRECAFDGTGDTTTFTRTKDSTAALFYRLEHCRANDMLYYTMRKSGDATGKLYRCERDGTNDSLVYDPGNPGLSTGTGGDAGHFCFDNGRSKLYALSRVNSSPYSGSIIRMDLDGTNQETVVATGNYIAPYINYGVYGVSYSHKDDKIYWFEGSNPSVTSGSAQDPDAGLFRANYDGTSEEKLSDKFDLAIGAGAASTLGNFDIGCGFETLGAATEH